MKLPSSKFRPIFILAGYFLLFFALPSLSGQSKPEKTEPAEKATCNHPRFKNQTSIGICQQGHSCKKWTFTNKKQNGVRFDVGKECAGLYEFTWGPCRYIVYKKTGTSGSYATYQKVDDITCSKNKKVTIAGSYFSNNTDCFIILYETAPSVVYNTIYYSGSGGGSYCKDTSGAPIISTGISDYWRFTTLNFKGESCGGESN